MTTLFVFVQIANTLIHRLEAVTEVNGDRQTVLRQNLHIAVGFLHFHVVDEDLVPGRLDMESLTVHIILVETAAEGVEHHPFFTGVDGKGQTAPEDEYDHQSDGTDQQESGSFSIHIKGKLLC